MSFSDVSSVTNYFPTPNEGFTTTTSGSVASAGTTVGLNSVAGLTNGTIFVGIIEPGTVRERTFTGTVSTGTTSITGVIWTRGTSASGHAVGSTVVDYVTGTAIKMMTTGFLKQHTQAGAHTAITATSLTTTGGVTAGSGLTVSGGTVSGVLNRLSNPYKFSAYCSTGKSITNQSLIVDLQTELFDTNNNFATSRYTAPVSGFYQINAQVWLGSAGAGTAEYGSCEIRKNGTAILVSPQDNGSGDAGKLIRPRIGSLIQLAAGDYIELWATFTGGRDIAAGQAYTYMNGFLVSAT